jgi:ABC-type dipeptide/oligopeptide/nickel transport system permease component
MLRFVLRRLQIALLVAVTVSIVGFSLLRASGDIALVLAGENAKPEEVVRISHAYGLDKPLYMQYLDWGGKALSGDLGRSLFTNEPVTGLILDRLPVTIYVAVPALIISLLIAVPLGVLAATRPNTWIDRAALSFAVTGSALPSFWLALMLIYLFGVILRWLPISGSDTWWNFVMPWITVAIGVIPLQMRLTRTGMLDVLSSDFIRTARAKGLSGASVMFKHALRNAILPVVSVAAVSLGFLLGNSLVVESVFALNGVGMLAYQSILRLDFPVVQSIIVFISFCYIFLTLMSDIINAKLDPRIGLR